MEKTMSSEERIRRAEEIYAKRRENNGNNLNNISTSSSQVLNNEAKTNLCLYKKLVIKILICVLIYLIFSIIKSSSYIFSNNFISKSKEILDKDINFSLLRNNLEKLFEKNKDEYMHFIKIFNNKEKDESKGKEQTEEDRNDEVNENMPADFESKDENNNDIDVGIGGANIEQGVVFIDETDVGNKTQMEVDAEYIRKNFTCVLPVKGRITSPYGKREPTKIVSANHQGIDIGVVEGTKILSAIDGEVSMVSKQGEYGTHLKIVNKDITTIYAHCSEILVKEKDKIKAGQLIALSGNTGKTTGPHLHFEVRRETRTIDPELILNWK